MLRFPKLLLFLLFAIIASATCPCHAHRDFTYDLTTLCFLSTDVVEARLIRHHIPGQEDWKDTFTATVLNPLEGSYHVGDQIKGLNLTSNNPANTGQHCLLFLTPNTVFSPIPPKDAPLRVVDMLVIDSRNCVRRYFQWSNPGGLVAEGFYTYVEYQTEKTMYINGVLTHTYKGCKFAEGNTAQQKYPTLAEERKVIASRWAAAKKLKTPPYQVLHQTER